MLILQGLVTTYWVPNPKHQSRISPIWFNKNLPMAKEILLTAPISPANMLGKSPAVTRENYMFGGFDWVYP